VGDLDHIFAHIFIRQGAEAADRFLELANEAADFRPNTHGQVPRWATRHKDLRFWVISRTNFLIYYLPDDQG
jgi:hypothetical protein